MHKHTLIKRSLAVGLMAAAAVFPAAAQARYAEDAGGPPSAAQVPVTAPQPASQTRGVASLQSGAWSFEWGDAGIGAAGTLALLGIGAGTTAVTRSRRRHDVIGG